MRASLARRARGGAGRLAAALGVALATIGAGAGAAAQEPRDFRPDRDGLAFANELYWEYQFGSTPAETTTRPRAEPVTFGNRCFAMARAVRQFHLAARFEPDAPRLDPEETRERIRRVLATDPRELAPARDPIAIPGYDGLRALSADFEEALKEALGGRLESYLQRGNWRLVFAFGADEQRETARALVEKTRAGELPIVHVVSFPETAAINHALVVYAAEEDAVRIRLAAYDPNRVDAPVTLDFRRATGSFSLERTPYFAGGEVNVYEIYRDALY